jgi:hypothetical protein
MSQITTLSPAGSSPAGDVVGPASSTDNAITLWDGTTGKLIKDSSTLILEGTGSATGIVTADLVTFTLSAATNTAYHLEAMIVGYEDTGPGAARYKVNSIVYTDTAAATLVGTADTDSDESAALAAGDATIVVSGNTAIVRVTGVAGLTINFRASLKVVGVS